MVTASLELPSIGEDLFQGIGEGKRRRYPEPVKRKAAELYIAGYSVDLIAQRLNVSPRTLSTWNQRGGWTKLRNIATQSIRESYQKQQTDEWTKDSKDARQRAGRYVSRAMAVLDAEPLPANLDALSTQCAKLEPVVRVAERIFDWEHQGASRHTAGESLAADIRLDLVLHDRPVDNQVIDVSSVDSESDPT